MSETELANETSETQNAAPPGAADTAGAADDRAGADLANAGADSAAGAEGVEIDGRRFTNEAEALAWAKSHISEVNTEKAIAEAYRAGIQDSLGREIPAASAAAVPPEDDKFEERFYANPKEALAERDRKLAEQIRAELRRESEASRIDREVWDRFTGLHPDLADFRTDVEAVANAPQFKEIVTTLARTQGEEKAMQFVAQKTRAKFQAYVEATKSKTVLPRGSGAGPTPSGTQKSVTQPKKEEKPLSMKEQLRQLKSKQRN